jgi:hypothetical protein
MTSQSPIITPQQLVAPGSRGPHGQVFVRGVEISLLRPGKGYHSTNSPRRPTQKNNKGANRNPGSAPHLPKKITISNVIPSPQRLHLFHLPLPLLQLLPQLFHLFRIDLELPLHLLQLLP